jgi:hypothetical protein
LKVQSFAFFGNFEARTLLLKFPNKTGVPEKEIFPVLAPKKDQTGPKIPCLETLILMGNFNGNILAQKIAKKGKDWTFKH